MTSTTTEVGELSAQEAPVDTSWMGIGAVIAPKIHGEFEVDLEVVKALKERGGTLKYAYHYGNSKWGSTAKVTAEQAGGSLVSYFLKLVPYSYPAQVMCEGEFESLKALHEVVPSFIPAPYKWGPLSDGSGCFLLTEFREVGQQPPNVAKFCKSVAQLHEQSISPTGKFGFHVTTCHGSQPQYVGWEDSWRVMFTKILSRAMDTEERHNGPFPEFAAVRKLLFEVVIPRLLDPLQADGRSIKPCLVHGDLWDQNCADDMNTGEPFAFDAACMYAHNEFEIGFWRPKHIRFNKTYIKAYKKHFPISEPEEDWDDRNLLYSMRWNMSLSVLVPSSGQRQAVFEDMKTLCRKYCPEESGKVLAQFEAPSFRGDEDDDDLEVEEDDEDQLELDSGDDTTCESRVAA